MFIFDVLKSQAKRPDRVNYKHCYKLKNYGLDN